jgi:hypothetical protein
MDFADDVLYNIANVVKRYGEIIGAAPASTPIPPPGPVQIFHTFAKGDTLWSIGKLYKVPWTTIRLASNPTSTHALNPLAMHYGDVLLIK